MKILVGMGGGHIVDIKSTKFPYITRLASKTLKCIDEFEMGEFIKPKLNIIFSKLDGATSLTLEYDDRINSSVLILDRIEDDLSIKNKIQMAIIRLLTIQKEV